MRIDHNTFSTLASSLPASPVTVTFWVLNSLICYLFSPSADLECFPQNGTSHLKAEPRQRRTTSSASSLSASANPAHRPTVTACSYRRRPRDCVLRPAHLILTSPPSSLSDSFYPFFTFFCFIKSTLNSSPCCRCVCALVYPVAMLLTAQSKTITEAGKLICSLCTSV